MKDPKLDLDAERCVTWNVYASASSGYQRPRRTSIQGLHTGDLLHDFLVDSEDILIARARGTQQSSTLEESGQSYSPAIAKKGVAFPICLTGISARLFGTLGPESNHMTSHTAWGMATQKC